MCAYAWHGVVRVNVYAWVVELEWHGVAADRVLVERLVLSTRDVLRTRIVAHAIHAASVL